MCKCLILPIHFKPIIMNTANNSSHIHSSFRKLENQLTFHWFWIGLKSLLKCSYADILLVNLKLHCDIYSKLYWYNNFHIYFMENILTYIHVLVCILITLKRSKLKAENEGCRASKFLFCRNPIITFMAPLKDYWTNDIGESLLLHHVFAEKC